MIKLVVLDVDGVILGTKMEHNFPFPSSNVVNYLTELQNKGLPISLCTGKPPFAVKKIVEKINLDNPHITNGGATIYDPIDDKIIQNSTLSRASASHLIDKTKGKKVFWQVYTLDTKYIDKTVYPMEIIEDSRIMPWTGVEDIMQIAHDNDFAKMEAIYAPEEEDYLRELFDSLNGSISVQWTYAKQLLPLKIVILTTKGMDKERGVEKLCEFYKIKKEEVLAVGDTHMDWLFMRGCGYKATLANANDEMKKLVTDSGGFMGGDVDDDGIIDVFKYYNSLFAFK